MIVPSSILAAPACFHDHIGALALFFVFEDGIGGLALFFVLDGCHVIGPERRCI
jgi:hypothetical protein